MADAFDQALEGGDISLTQSNTSKFTNRTVKTTKTGSSSNNTTVTGGGSVERKRARTEAIRDENGKIIGRRQVNPNEPPVTVTKYKPDGTPIKETPAATSVAKGTAERSTNTKEAGSTQKIKNGTPEPVKTDKTKTASKSGINLSGVIANPMEQFASYSPLWTMAVLTPQQFNNPDSYRTADLSFAGQGFGSGATSSIIFSSAGRGDQYRTNTYYGAPEYFVDNFMMKSIISATPKTGNSNAVKFEFDVYEPFSMGLFLQSLQNAAIKAGYANYLDNCPYLLRLDFKGFNEKGEQYSSIKPKYFVMKLSGVKFAVDESGSNYKVEAIPYNHQAYSNVINTVYTDISIKAGKDATVESLLVSGPESLCAVLNRNEQKLVEEKRISIPDVYEVQFPEKSSDFIPTTKLPITKSATTNGSPPKKVIKGTDVEVRTDFGNNPIGKANFGFDASKGGNFVFAKEGDVVDEETGKIQRDKMIIDPKKRTFLFSQGQSLTEIINQVIISSTYAKKAIEPPVPSDGFIRWYRLDIQVEFLDFDLLVGDYAKKVIFRVVPFLVHHSIFSNPNSAPIGYDQLEKKITKKYEYIYTGQNNDITNFEIKIDNLFFTGANSSAEGNTASEVSPDQQGPAPKPGKKTETPKGAAPETQTSYTGRARPLPDPSNLKPKQKGGSGTKDTEQMIAESFHNAFVSGSSADMISVDLEVLGDPYWLVDSGTNNYFASTNSETDLINADGTANYEGSDVYIYIGFRTPADVDVQSGLYQFSKQQQESPFSGIYKVTACENMFNDGKFMQTLTCIRMPGQSADFDGQKVSKSPDKASAVQTTGPKPEPTGPTDSSNKNAKTQVA